VADPGALALSRAPGLPDEAFQTDGQITKREIRALTLAALVPLPGQLLWDVGAGSGSIGIEWMRIHPSMRAIAVEPRADRRERIAANAERLGVPALQVVDGSAPEGVLGLPAPDAVFVGGAVSVDGVVEAGRAALCPGGRLVANAVTLESEAVLARWYAQLGGTLTRIAVQRADAVGGFTGWRPAMPVTQWTWVKP
jgi:precorrin-6Y C5,15-methyltransferase (decarboxylating)